MTYEKTTTERSGSFLNDIFNIRTDLAVEERERFTERNIEITGVKLTEQMDSEDRVKITRVEVLNESGAKAMGRPIGSYVTIEAKDMDASLDISSVLSRELEKMLIYRQEKPLDKMSVLVVGLGNRDVTPDSLGPSVISRLDVSRHIYMLKEDNEKSYGVSAVIPGVMAQSGMESAEMVSGIVKQIEPDVVIAIDALAARNTRRLNTTIQLADTGIHPGSGVGNHRQGLNEETLGVPVIAIGIPTVVDAATIVSDAMDALIGVLSSADGGESISESLKIFSDKEKYQLIKELLEPQIGAMFVTPKDIDEDIEIMANIVADGINKVFV